MVIQVKMEKSTVIQVKILYSMHCIPMEGTRVMSGSKWTGINKEATKPYLCNVHHQIIIKNYFQFHLVLEITILKNYFQFHIVLELTSNHYLH